MKCSNAGRRAGRFGRQAGVLSLTLIGGCAMPELADREAAEYERVDRQLRAAEELKAFSRACRASGGTVYVVGSWGRLRSSPADTSRPTCVAPSSGLVR